jgi:hypothetical protein
MHSKIVKLHRPKIIPLGKQHSSHLLNTESLTESSFVSVEHQPTGGIGRSRSTCEVAASVWVNTTAHHLSIVVGKIEGVLVGTRCNRSTSFLLLSDRLVVHELVHLFSIQDVKVSIVRVHQAAELEVLLHLWFLLFLCVWRIIVFQQSPNAFFKIHIQSHFVGILQVGGAGAGRQAMSAVSWASRDMVNRLQTQQETQKDR